LVARTFFHGYGALLYTLLYALLLLLLRSLLVLSLL
jgi:hypothetical protein